LAAEGSFAYVNFDDERLRDLDSCDELIQALPSVYGHTRRVFFDEIQNLPRWEMFVNRLHREGYDLTLTGSNANLLSSELATHLTGRFIAQTILPFSFDEYLEAGAGELTEAQKTASFRDYLEQGGFPEIRVKHLDYRSYLTTLLDAVLFKDVVRRHRIRSAQGIGNVAQYALSNTAREYSFARMREVAGTRSDHSVKKYLGLLEEAYILFSLARFSPKARLLVTAPRKLFCYDNGLITARGLRSSPDLGRLLENAVAVDLRRRSLDAGFRLSYWKNQQQEEVDFVVQDGYTAVALIQVCWDPHPPHTRSREMRALLKASRDVRCDHLFLLTADQEGEESVEWFGIKRAVKVVPAWKWLTEERYLLERGSS